jgi:DNA-binding CsgD family transcriptional regulator
MASATSPTPADLRALLRLSHVLHTSADGAARKKILLAQLGELLGASCALSVVTLVALPSRRPTPISVIRHGNSRPDATDERMLLRCLRAADTSARAARRAGVDRSASLWRHVDSLYRRSHAFRLHHCLWCEPPDCEVRIVACLCFERPPEQRRSFTARERTLLHIAHSEQSWIYQGDLLLATRGGMAVSPRQRQVLDYLLAGHSEKQIAEKLRLSPNTVHHHVKALHRHFGVSTRSELLARWVK